MSLREEGRSRMPVPCGGRPVKRGVVATAAAGLASGTAGATPSPDNPARSAEMGGGGGVPLSPSTPAAATIPVAPAG